MTKGTPSFGKHSGKKTHIRCRRCHHRSYHVQKKRCAYCGFPSARIRRYAWQKKVYSNNRRKA
ncbi:MAG: 50S ribosomal protein L37e [Candidatus Hodarchaeales archaeon]